MRDEKRQRRRKDKRVFRHKNIRTEIGKIDKRDEEDENR